MEYEIVVEPVSEQLIVAAKQRTTFKMVSREIQNLLSRPWAYIKQHRSIRTDGHNVAIYWDETGEGSVEVGVQIISRLDETSEVICSATPAGTIARTAHFGPYSQLGPAHEAVRRWCSQNGRPHIMPFWEVYGDWSDDPAKLRTDVCYLISRDKSDPST